MPGSTLTAALALRRVEPHGIDTCATQLKPGVKGTRSMLAMYWSSITRYCAKGMDDSY
jgi:hypothetical protein